MTNKRALISIFIMLALVIIIGLVSFSCGMLFLPTLSALAPTPSPTFTVTASPTFTPTPFPPIYVTLNVNEFATYTIYWKRELWESAIRGTVLTEDFENDDGNYGELNFPYLTGKGFLLNGHSSAQIFKDNTLLSSGNLIHFRDWHNGLRFSFPNNSVVSAFSFDYKASETWQLTFNDFVITIPDGRNRFIGIIVHRLFPTDFILFSLEGAQGGLSVDNISYIQIFDVTAVPASTYSNVTITAADGNLNIRRGPGADYNPIGTFLNGQSAIATARNENGTWLYVPMPGTTNQFGWVNATTRLSRVLGNLDSLPVMTVEPAVPAYVRNCTSNQMLLRPSELRIDNLINSPNNVVLVFPDDYEVYDTTVSGGSPVQALIVREGNIIDITIDGSNQTHSCP